MFVNVITCPCHRFNTDLADLWLHEVRVTNHFRHGFWHSHYKKTKMSLSQCKAFYFKSTRHFIDIYKTWQWNPAGTRLFYHFCFHCFSGMLAGTSILQMRWSDCHETMLFQFLKVSEYSLKMEYLQNDPLHFHTNDLFYKYIPSIWNISQSHIPPHAFCMFCTSHH